MSGGTGTTAAPIGQGGTLLGAGIKAFSDWINASAEGAMYTTEATDAANRAQAYRTAAETTDYAGQRAAEATGLQYRAAVGRQAVGYAAGNIAGRTVGDVRGSQLALGQLSERETQARYGEMSYQERIKAAEAQAASGRYAMAAGAARRAGEFAIATDITAGITGAATQGIKASELTPTPSNGSAGAPLDITPSIAGDSGSVDPKWLQASDLMIG